MRLLSIVAGIAVCGLSATMSVAKPSDASLIGRDWKAVRPSGPAVDCVQINRIRSSTVRDGSTIDFELPGGKVLRNVIPNGCPGLSPLDAFSYATSLSKLCSVDIITVIPQSTPFIRGASCGLGSFQPVVPAR